MPALSRNVDRMIEFYNSEVGRFADGGRGAQIDNFIDADPLKFSWNRADKVQLKRGTRYAVDATSMRESHYRPFQKQHVYFNRQANDMVYRMGELFPSADRGTIGIYLVAGTHRTPFSLISTDLIPDVGFYMDAGQFFARYSYTQPAPNALFGEPERIENITDWALGEYQRKYGDDVTKDDIFFYIYGLLHSPEYREKYASDLKKQLPRIPMVAGRDRFDAFVSAGRTLSDLHINYEQIEPYPLTETMTVKAPVDQYERHAVTKMKYAGKAGSWHKSRIIYNSYITLEGVPEEAQRYMLGSRSALDWIIERYQVKTDKASGIVNDPNDWSREHQEPRYIINLLARITTVSLETMKIIDALPKLSV